MADEQPTSGGGGLGSTLSARIGPLPTWQWIALITAAGVAYYLLIGKNKAGTTAPATDATADTTPANDVPQFVIQNYLPPYAPAMAQTTPTQTTPDQDVNPVGPPAPAPTTPSAPAKVPTPTAKTPIKQPKAKASVKVVKYTTKNPPWNSTISGIANHYGIRDWHTVWNSPLNAALRARRKNPQSIQPQDVVYVP